MKDKSVYIALLKGVNVGGNKLVPMKELAALFGEIGCLDSRTYIQSGNVVFRAGCYSGGELQGVLSKEISKKFGFSVNVVVRSAAEMNAVSLNNPFLEQSKDEKLLHVSFLADEPDLTDVVALSPECSDDEAFSLRGREIFFYMPNGVGKSKLMTYDFGKKLKTVATARNWRTVSTLKALAHELETGGGSGVS